MYIVLHLFILLNSKDAASFPELFCTPFLIHATYGGGFPEALQVMVALRLRKSVPKTYGKII